MNFRRFEHLVTSSYVSKRFTKLLFTWAQILIDLESFKQSIRYLEECSLRGFSRKLVSTRLVLSYIGLQNIEKALEYLNILVDMGDADINIYVLRCRILLHLEKWFEAASDLKVATNINPSHVTLYELKLQILQHAVTLKNEANSCISRDDLKCAESFLDQALKLDEDDWRAIFVRGTLLKRLNIPGFIKYIN